MYACNITTVEDNTWDLLRCFNWKTKCIAQIECTINSCSILGDDGVVWRINALIGDNLTFNMERIHDDVKWIACGAEHELILTYDNTILARGNNSRGQCGIDNNSEIIEEFTVVKAFNNNSEIIQVHGAGFYSVVAYMTVDSNVITSLNSRD